MKQKIDKTCGCLIEDILSEAPETPQKGIMQKSDRLCSTSSSDMEVFIGPDVEKISLDFYQKKYTDGLPIIPPTPERVRKFYKYSKQKPQEVTAVLPPLQGKATVEKIAINSVMAGCLPLFMPIIETAISSISQEKFNLAGINATTHPVAICTIVNGPVSKELEFNSAAGCLGPGNLANSTIGRALRFCLMNIAGAVPSIGDHATMGSPAKYSYCFSENEEESPWPALHVERGHPKDSSTVTVLGMEAPHNVNDHRSQSGKDLLDTIIHTASTAGCNNSHVPGELLVIMSPEHTKTLVDDEWSKIDIKKYIHENTMVPVKLGDRGGRRLDKKWVKKDMVHITRSLEDVVLVVAGGTGRHTMVAHGFGTSCQSITTPLTLKDGSYVKSVKDYIK
ncbi:hypothetical protein [Methanobacterium alcaliphilum]|uniref:hypothetical protein n=1 Tax=Methanobacterium alcaliphilum TaxID=392018 RepID=UPI00200B7B0E|nr:hypothetical protein [Methanobacterium alcaliphilum]MCK9151996.1 hypothetical protein [Methanobacterium alcaliphilum]